jgi:hypothetical protein
MTMSGNKVVSLRIDHHESVHGLLADLWQLDRLNEDGGVSAWR